MGSHLLGLLYPFVWAMVYLMVWAVVYYFVDRHFQTLVTN